MVSVRQPPQRRPMLFTPQGFVVLFLAVVVACFLVGAVLILGVDSGPLSIRKGAPAAPETVLSGNRNDHATPTKAQPSNYESKNNNVDHKCAYRTLDDLTPEERFPRKGPRHSVDPPTGGKHSLVCCETTAGPLSLVAHHRWAPGGARRFLEMVESGYFDAGVPLMRCVRNFLCQFGLSADPSRNKLYRSIGDDPNWLPEGPPGRTNEEGVPRFARGYLAYAGAGPNSRGTQFIVSLKTNERLAGGSPWEVPWGELVSQESFETLGKIHTGYGEKGPGQGKLTNKGWTDEMNREFPLLDHVRGCRLLDEREF